MTGKRRLRAFGNYGHDNYLVFERMMYLLTAAGCDFYNNRTEYTLKFRNYDGEQMLGLHVHRDVLDNNNLILLVNASKRGDTSMYIDTDWRPIWEINDRDAEILWKHFERALILGEIEITSDC